MNKIILSIGAILVGLNLLFGLMLSSYNSFHIVLTSFVLLFATGIIFLTSKIIKDKAFLISLMCIFSITGVIKLITGCFSPETITDNWWVISIVLLSILDIIILMIVRYVSKINATY